MILIIGGFAQGKTEYVKDRFKESDLVFYDAKLPSESVSSSNESNDSAAPLARKTIVINHLHELIKARLKAGANPEAEIKEFIAKCDCIIICDEIGNGIVPMDAFEREYRERTGRILIELAKKANCVERVICGIGQRIK